MALCLAHIWEIAFKQGLGRRISGALVAEIMEVAYAQERFAEPGLCQADIFTLEALPLHHHEAFDWPLLAQAAARGLTLTIGDSPLQPYDMALINVCA